MPALDPATESTVARLWAHATATRRLFNGRVFCADTVTPTLITGHWTEYRRITAQIADPTLCATLEVRNLAVCGILSTPDGIVIGRREANSAYQPGLWQLPPAGSVDQTAAEPGGASWRHALLVELREELGLLETDIQNMRPLCMVQHPTGVLDMGIQIHTTLSAAEIIARHQSHGDAEYDRLLILPRHTLVPTIEAQGGRLVPSARAFLQALP